MTDSSNISNIFRGSDNEYFNSKRIKYNNLLILKNENKIQIAVEFHYRKYGQTKLKISLNEFLKESNKNNFLKMDYTTNQQIEIVAFTDNNFLTKNDYNIRMSKKNKKEIIQPIAYFDFYCNIHGKKYTYYCLDCNMHICDKCKLLFFNHKKTIIQALKNIFCLAIESDIKIKNNDNKSLKNVIDKKIEIYNSELLNKDKNHKHQNLIYIEDYKLSDEELKYYDNKIKEFSKKLENSKEINSYTNNILLLKYCKMYIEFYRKNKEIGLNYTIINIIKNNIKFNEKFLSQNNKQNNNELILNIPIDKSNNSIFFMEQIHKITYPDLDVLNINRNWDFETIISIFVSNDKTKFIVTLSTGIIKIYDIPTFKLLYKINFIEICKKSNNNNNFNIKRDYFYAKMISNGNIIVTNCENRAYLIKIEKDKYIIEKLFEKYNDYISFFTEIPKNKHFVTGGKKINIYKYNYEKILSIEPVVEFDDSAGEPIVKNLVYLSNKNLLICLMAKYGPQASRSSGITICNTKNSLYRIIWEEGGVYPVNDSPYSLAINKEYLVIFSNKIYNLDNGNSIHINYDNSWSDCSCGIFFRQSWIVKERFNNNLYQFDKDFIMISKIPINNLGINYITKNGLLKITDEIICYFNSNEIIFLK